MIERNFFPKNERLFLQKDIDRLFDKGQSFVSYPLRIIYLHVIANPLTDNGISILISVPKKRIRRAVKRNRIKRLIREAYRLNKKEILTLYKEKGKHLHLAFLYISDDIKPFNDINKAVRKALEIIRKKN